MTSPAPPAAVSDAAELPWYLVQSRPNQHHIAVSNLRRRGLTPFLPLQRVTRRWRSRLLHEARPLFPGYLFVAPDPARPDSAHPDARPASRPGALPDWRAIATTRGVCRLVCFGNAPGRVPAALVAGLRLRCDAEGVLQSAPDIAPGETVRLVAGPFAGFVATVETVGEDARLGLLFELMGRTTRIAARPDALVRLGSGPVRRLEPGRRAG